MQGVAITAAAIGQKIGRIWLQIWPLIGWELAADWPGAGRYRGWLRAELWAKLERFGCFAVPAARFATDRRLGCWLPALWPGLAGCGWAGYAAATESFGRGLGS